MDYQEEEQDLDNTLVPVTETKTNCEGSDSGIEFQEFKIHNSHEQELKSCDSSLISVCSNYDEAYNLLVRKNSTLLEDYTRNGDVTSDNGSESSSISNKSRKNRNGGGFNKRGLEKSNVAKESRSRSKPINLMKNNCETVRLKSVDRLQSKVNNKTTGSRSGKSNNFNSLDLLSLPKRDLTKRPSSATPRTPSGSRGTPQDDGRWPSINSRPAPLMARSLKMSEKPKISPSDTKTIEKYATLPRRKTDKCNTETTKSQTTSRALVKRSLSSTTPSKATNLINLNVNNNNRKQRVKIYHETSSQTALTNDDLENAFSGLIVTVKNVEDTEKCCKSTQVDKDSRLIRELNDKLLLMQKECKEHKEKLHATELKLKEEIREKESLKSELECNTQRVLAILGDSYSDNSIQEDGGPPSSPGDSLLVLGKRFQNVSGVMLKQEEEISKLNELCRSLQLELERNIRTQYNLMQQHQEMEMESFELQEFMQAEKITLQEALKESENEMMKMRENAAKKEREICEENKRLAKSCEKLRQENLSLQARLGVLESKSRELLMRQGSSVSGAAVALSALINRLDGLVEELVQAYNISEQELEDVIFHNEAYKNSSSSPDSTPEKSRKMFIEKMPSPSQKGSSFVSAVINAIKNAAQSPFAVRDNSKDNLCTERSMSNEMLDLETEPCLMMEHVLEDVIIPDGHSQNLVSSFNSHLTHSESLTDMTNARHTSWSCYASLDSSFTTNDSFTSSQVDQVIHVDNLVTKLLKVIRIIQMENEDYMYELQEQRESLLEQLERHSNTNKVMAKQLKDWETLSARLRGEIKDLTQQLSKKGCEIDMLKCELNKEREEVEKLNKDVCDVSTALAKTEMEVRRKEDEVNEEMKKWEDTGAAPGTETVARLLSDQNELVELREKLAEKEKHLAELSQEYAANRQVLTENLKEAMNESKKQYEAIDCALEVLHSIQSVVQQCPPLSKLQRDLEQMNFQSASSLPLVTPSSDCNANAGLIQTVTINSTA